MFMTMTVLSRALVGSIHWAENIGDHKLSPRASTSSTDTKAGEQRDGLRANKHANYTTLPCRRHDDEDTGEHPHSPPRSRRRCGVPPRPRILYHSQGQVQRQERLRRALTPQPPVRAGFDERPNGDPYARVCNDKVCGMYSGNESRSRLPSLGRGEGVEW